VATLRIFRGDQFVAPFELGEGRTRIGRGTENQLVLEDRDKQVSRTHAEIRHERGQYLITDLNSQNGVWIGERQIKSEEAVPVNVPVTIGPYRLILTAEEPAQPAAGVADVAATAPEPSVEPTQLGEIPTLPPPPSRPVQAAPAPLAPAPKPPAPARTQTGKTPAPSATAGNTRIVIIGAAVAAALIAALAVMFLRKSPAPESTIVSDSSTTSSTTSTVPAGPTPEEVFQDHYGKAQTLIVEGNKTGARDENTAALAALPDDPRGVAQRTAIDGLPDTPVAAPPTAVETPPGTSPVAAPPLAETLRVTARAGESNAQRANREKTARTHLEDGKKAVAEQKWVNAIDLLQAALTTSGRQDYGTVANEAATQLARARKERDAFVVGQRTAAARRLVAEARALGTSDIPQAIQKLRDARELDAAADGAAELQSSLQEQARSQGETALGSAKNFDFRNRADQAIREYERAVQLLELVPGGHKDLALARQRLAELKR
jgi:pSer/pThr/pTyr-binding forkhead associated (FHA) protein